MAAKPETATEALDFQAYERWLREDITQKFFAALKARKESILNAAARKSVQTGTENATEHNNLVKASELLYIIETYEHPSKFPFTS